MAEVLEPDDPRGPFQLEPFYDSMPQWLPQAGKAPPDFALPTTHVQPCVILPAQPVGKELTEAHLWLTRSFISPVKNEKTPLK